MKRMSRSIALALALLLLAAGCGTTNNYTRQLDLTIPDPPASDTTQAAETFAAELPFVSDALTFVTETHQIQRYPGESRAYAAIRQMLEGPEGANLSASLPQGISLERVELAGHVANVVYSGLFLDEASWLVARAATAQVVCGLEKGISAVNVYLDDEEPGYQGRLLGTMTPLAESLDVYLERMDIEYAQPDEDDRGMSEAYAVTHYYFDAEQRGLLGAQRLLEYARESPLDTVTYLLVNAYLEGAKASEQMVSTFPEGLALATPPRLGPMELEAEPAILRADGTTGECEVFLTFTPPGAEFDRRAFHAALTLTVAGAIPEVRAVSVQYVGEPADAGKEAFARMERREALSYLGHVVYLLYPERDGSMLARTPVTVPQETVYDPPARLRTLLDYAPPAHTEYPVFHSGDLLSVYVDGTTAVVDWAPGFSQKLSALIQGYWSQMSADRRERMFLFGVIGSLCEIPGITKVWMLEDGKVIDAVERVYLAKAIPCNPGLVIFEN